ncbi:hypothetical protein B566_EDAN005401 [Ephemera danica]|nr:hypothetical protein B566_EDAN005401 [Ephemera danica]
MAAILPDSDSEDELPPGWEERATTDGNVYYVQYKQVNAEGKVFYVDHINHRTTYADPRLAFAVEEKDHPGDFRQRFDASSTALQVLHGRDLSGKVAIVTGANCGIGFETARTLALHGCSVVLGCRSISTAEEAIGKIKGEEKHTGPLECIQLDLTSLHSLDFLILNAAVFALPFSLTEDDFEMHFQVNHLSHFYLTLMLKPELQATLGSRVVFVSSESHRMSWLTSSSISEERLSPRSAAQFQGSMAAYNDSKLCNVLASMELARRWGQFGIAVNSLHPGNLVSSSLSRNWWFYRLLFAFVRPFTKSLQQAASTSVFVATAPELVGVCGLYFNNCCRCQPSGPANDPELAKELWEISVGMIERVMGAGACGDQATQ